MSKTTQLGRVKSVATALLLTDLNDTEFSPAIVQHPFTSSGITAVRRNGEMIMLNISQSEDDLKAWRFFMTERIKKADSLYDIYSMINKPYALTFLKLASPFMSREDFSELLADAWVRSESPNCDPNFMKNELVRMFKEADPTILMDETEQRELKALDETVTVYRGVTSHNAKNIRALSWTLDREVAEWFAHRFDEDGTVYELWPTLSKREQWVLTELVIKQKTEKQLSQESGVPKSTLNGWKAQTLAKLRINF